jgi:hypothetical protein
MEPEIHEKCQLSETEAANGERGMEPEIHEKFPSDETEAMNRSSEMEPGSLKTVDWMKLRAQVGEWL